jgi:hypothetical protein
MLIKMTPAKTGTRQNFTVVLDQDEMAALVYQLQRAPLRPRSTSCGGPSTAATSSCRRPLSMGDFAETHQPCPCGKSSDAYSVYASGVGHCFSCGKSFAPEGGEDGPNNDDAGLDHRAVGGLRNAGQPLITDVDIVPLTKRGIHQGHPPSYGRQVRLRRW